MALAFLYERPGAGALGRVRVRDEPARDAASTGRDAGLGASMSRRLASSPHASRTATDRPSSTCYGAKSSRASSRHVNDACLRSVSLGNKAVDRVPSPDGTRVAGVRDDAAWIRSGAQVSDDLLHVHGGPVGPVRVRLRLHDRSTSRRTATWSSSRTRAARPDAARISCARSTRPGASRITTT